MGEMKKDRKIAELRVKVKDVEPLEDEQDFHTLESTLWRYLEARDWDVSAAEKLLRGTVEYRRKHKPHHVVCTWCHNEPGYHSMRQVGFDKLDRPVIYSNFPQSSAKSNDVEDSLTHCIYLVENAMRSAKPDIYSWVWILDCAGLPLSACNPKNAYEVAQVMTNHYPERLGLCIVINHSLLFQGVWRAVKMFLPASTKSKFQFYRNDSQIEKACNELFPEELADWIVEEVQANKLNPVPQSQKEFWNKPEAEGVHDPRGCQSYITEYIEHPDINLNDMSVHKPHPNTVDWIKSQKEDQVLQAGEQ